MTNTPISITVMPLPYVLTDVVDKTAWRALYKVHFHNEYYFFCTQAIKNWKPIGEGEGITSEVRINSS